MKVFKKTSAAVAICFLATVFGSAQASSTGDSSTFLDRASLGMITLSDTYHWQPCHWYEPWTWGQLCQAGTWQKTLAWGWWDSANALNYTAEYSALSGDPSYLDLIQNGFDNRHNPDYIARNFTDDEGWWALAWIAASDLPDLRDRSQSANYLNRAKFIFNDMVSYWDSHCGGGIWWQKKPKSYKNSIANELFMSIAIKLYNRTHDEQYLGWANTTYAWFFGQSGLYTSGKLIVDGLDDSTCKVPTNGGLDTWTYNQGVVLGALVEMKQLDLAKSIANTVLTSPAMNPHGILTEVNEYSAPKGCTGGDCQQFKGIFMRGLGDLFRHLPDADPDKKTYAHFIAANARSVWDNDRIANDGAPLFDVHWAGPIYGDINAATQTSAVSALIEAIPLDSTPF
jgi:predicted alpha-1,6-mannanase (GH76 family)